MGNRRSVPESEKLIVISTYFNVSVDYLIKDDAEISDSSRPTNSANKADIIVKYVGLGLCILGFLFLIAWGVVMIANPGISNDIANSSMITIDGRGILLIVCCVLVAVGIILLLKKHNRR